jgi:hypothetical protein
MRRKSAQQRESIDAINVEMQMVKTAGISLAAADLKIVLQTTLARYEEQSVEL